jgi:hypothetical protein
MAKGDVIELQQPFDYDGGVASTPASDKEEFAYNLGNEHDQADMFRLGKQQKLDVRRVTKERPS